VSLPSSAAEADTPEKAWTVIPSMSEAATPVLAVIKVLSCGRHFFIILMRKLFPLPPLPIFNEKSRLISHENI